MSQRANKQTRGTGATRGSSRSQTRSQNRSQGVAEAKQAGASLAKKISAIFFGVGLNKRHPERERAAQERRRERALRRERLQNPENEGYATPVGPICFPVVASLRPWLWV